MTEVTQTTENTQAPEQGEAIQTVQIGEKFYDAKTVSELGWAIIRDMKTIDDKLKDYGLEMSIAKLAKAKLIDELHKEVPKMTEVQIQKAE